MFVLRIFTLFLFRDAKLLKVSRSTSWRIIGTVLENH